MGDVFKTSSDRLTIDYAVEASPGHTIDKVSVFYNGVIVYVARFDGKQSVAGSFTQALRAGREDYIFIEAMQSGSKRAWSSPLYVTYAPAAVPEYPSFAAAVAMVFGAGAFAWIGGKRIVVSLKRAQGHERKRRP